MKCLKNDDGCWITDMHVIRDKFVNFFSNLFTSCHPCYLADLRNFIPATISVNENQNLDVILHYDEIRDTLFHMSSFKSP